MARISTFMYCDNVQNQYNNMVVNSPMQIITMNYIPGMFSFSVIFGVLDINQYEDHRIRFVFKNEEEKVIIDTGEVNLPKNPNVENIPVEIQGFMASMDFRNTNFDSEGTYRSEIYIDGDSLGQFPIKVVVTKNE